MKQRHKTILLALVGLLIISTYVLFSTGGDTGTTDETRAFSSRREASLVDQGPFLRAQRLSQMPTSQAELKFAQAALQLGDQEMDLAFAAALLDATQHPA